MVQVAVQVFNTGWVPTHRRLVVSGGGGGRLRMPALFALLRHPERGVMLYDTGYHTDFYRATSGLPYRLMRLLTPAEIREEDNADRQLARAGVAADEVGTIILGHGHADHVPGVVGFPRAEVVMDRREWAAMDAPALSAWRHAYLKALYEKLPNRKRFIDWETDGAPLAGFDRALDLWGDGSMVLTPLPGHTPGQMGLLVNGADGRYFFIGDAAWVEENYLDQKPPAAPARMILASYDDFRRSLKKVLDFHQANPDVTIVPTHCPTTWERLQARSSVPAAQ